MDERCGCHSDSRRWLLTDFGFSTLFESNSIGYSHGRRGTPAYRSPELLERTYDESGNCRPGIISASSDIWSIGCILFRLATTNRRNAFEHDFDVVEYGRNKNGYDIPQVDEIDNEALKQETFSLKNGTAMPIWKQLNSILRQCFSRNPGERPSACELKTEFEEMKFALWVKSTYEMRTNMMQSPH